MSEERTEKSKSLTPKGWHSRRHQDAEAHTAAVAKFKERKTARKLTSMLNPHEQLRALNARLGKGRGAVRERARLALLTTAYDMVKEAYNELPADAKKRFVMEK